MHTALRLVPWLEIKIRADRRSLLTTLGHTPRSKIRALHTRTPHCATLGRYSRIYTARIRAHHTRIHTELRIRVPIPCVLTLHYLTVRAPDSCSLKDEHASNSWSELRIRVVFLLILQLFFFLMNHYSHSEVRMLLLRNLVPFRFCSKTSESLKAHKLLLSITAPFLFPRLRSPTPNSHRSRLPNPISTQKVSTDADVGFVVAVSDRSKKEMKVMVPMKSKNR